MKNKILPILMGLAAVSVVAASVKFLLAKPADSPTAVTGSSTNGSETAKAGETPARPVQEYHNVDVAKSHYAMTVPKDWYLKKGATAGSYTVGWDGGTGTVELVDVPADVTLDKFVLEKEEPRLKQADAGYNRLGFKKFAVGGEDAYQLTYYGSSGQMATRTYVSGAKKSAVVEISCMASNFDKFRDVIGSVVEGFKWESL